jgi:hypothetical protein
MTARYMLVTYYQQPNGKHEEVTEFRNNIKLKHLQSATVILDFKNKVCTVNKLNPQAGFDDMLEFYKRLLGSQLTPHLPQESL